VLELLLLDRFAVDRGDSVAGHATTSDGDRGSSGEGAQRQEESSNLDHEKALGGGTGIRFGRVQRFEPSSAEAW
jgi:hypothetical protein